MEVQLCAYCFVFFCVKTFSVRVFVIHTHPFNGSLSRTTQVSRYQKGKTSLDFTEQETVSGSGISWAICKSAPCSRQITMPAPHHQLGHMQVCTSLQTDNHTSTPPLSFLQAGCPSRCPTNSFKALKANLYEYL